MIEEKESVLTNYLKIVRDRLMLKTQEILSSEIIAQLENDKQLEKFLQEKNYDVNVTDLDEFKKREQENLMKEIENEKSIVWLTKELCKVVFNDL